MKYDELIEWVISENIGEYWSLVSLWYTGEVPSDISEDDLPRLWDDVTLERIVRS